MIRFVDAELLITVSSLQKALGGGTSKDANVLNSVIEHIKQSGQSTNPRLLGRLHENKKIFAGNETTKNTNI